MVEGFPRRPARGTRSKGAGREPNAEGRRSALCAGARAHLTGHFRSPPPDERRTARPAAAPLREPAHKRRPHYLETRDAEFVHAPLHRELRSRPVRWAAAQHRSVGSLAAGGAGGPTKSAARNYRPEGEPPI